MTDVALVTFAEFPFGWEDDLELVRALGHRGITSEFVCWDDTEARWSSAGLVLLRSPWDYHRRIDAFLDWLDFVGSVAPVWNPPEMVRWNAHKRYLTELRASGVPTVPTIVVERGGAHALDPAQQWIVKPAISAGADRTVRHAVQADLDALVATDDALVQPYVHEIETRGELSIICIDGEPQHALRKVPAAGDFRTQEHLGASVTLEPLDDDIRAIAGAAVGALDRTPLYARVDVADTPAGLLLMELELIEPTLWFRLHPETADAMAVAIEGRVR